MNTNVIPLKRKLTFQEYQLAVSALKEIGIEIEEPFSLDLNQKDFDLIEKSNKEAEKGLLLSNKEVHQKARELCMK